MPDNSIFAFEPPIPKEETAVLKRTDTEVAEIIESIKKGRAGTFAGTAATGTGGDILPLRRAEGHRTLIINNRCIECRICENVCPEQVIKVYCRRPVWNEEKCSMCICCLELCPKQAIDYGEAPVGKRRFYNKAYYEGSIGIKLKR